LSYEEFSCWKTPGKTRDSILDENTVLRPKKQQRIRIKCLRSHSSKVCMYNYRTSEINNWISKFGNCNRPIAFLYNLIGSFQTEKTLNFTMSEPEPVLLTVPTDDEYLEVEKEYTKHLSVVTIPGHQKVDSFFQAPKMKGSGGTGSSPLMRTISSPSSSGVENFQEIIKEHGVLVPLCISVFKQFESELSKFIGDKLTRFNSSEDIKVTFYIFTLGF
jgi:hypothetical protein